VEAILILGGGMAIVMTVFLLIDRFGVRLFGIRQTNIGGLQVA